MAALHCLKAKELLQEMQRSDFLPRYNDELVRNVVEEAQALWKELQETLASEGSAVSDPAVACGMVVQYDSIARNKQCLLAYLQRRLERIETIRWLGGGVMPGHVSALLSAQEKDYARGYDKLLRDYMVPIDVNLTTDLEPPKALFIEVEVLEDCGEIMTSAGPVKLEARSRHYLKRSDVEPLIRQGLLRQTDTEAS